MFAGVGGFHLGMSQAGHQCVGACEIDKYARSVYAKHFPGIRLWEDATKINPAELPDFECLTAGFPCQAFSIAGTRLGFEESRGTLFFEIARIAKEKRPKLLLLENVKGLLNHDKGRTFATIITTLDEIGYDISWQVLNSKYFVPQNRERVFIVGHLRGVSRREIFPLGDINCKTVEPKLEQLNDTPHDTGRIYHPDGIARSLRANSGGMGSKTGLYAVENSVKKIGNKNPSGNGQSGNVYDSNGIAPTLCASDATRGFNSSGYIAVTKDHGKLRKTKDQSLAIDANYWKGPDNHGQRTMIYMAHSKGNIKQRIQERENVWTITDNARDFGVIEPAIVADRSRSYAGKGRNLESPKEISNSLTSVCKDNYLLKDTRIRRLTPTECERLQGFEDDWTKYNVDGEIVSDTQRYRMCGNAVTVPVVKYVSENLF